MSEGPELQGEETTSVPAPKRFRRMLYIVPVVLTFGGIALWMTWPSADEILEPPEELEEITAAKAPPIVPAGNEAVMDVPPANDTFKSEDPNLAGPSFIPPVLDESTSIPESLAMPTVDLLTSTLQDQARSRLEDALNASPVAKIELVIEDEDVDPVAASIEDVVRQSHALTPGAVIPSVLLQGINTDLPGIAVAQVSRDVYDSRTGTRLLIPRGSRIFGTYGSEPVVSDQRVLVTWERIDLPNGAVIDLAKVIGSDQSGNAGLKDQVHRHTGRALAVTGLTSLITAGLTHAANANDPTILRETTEGRFVEEPSLAGDVSRGISQQYGNIVGQIAERHLDRQPTITIRPGYEFAIQIAEEISLRPYSP